MTALALRLAPSLFGHLAKPRAVAKRKSPKVGLGYRLLIWAFRNN
jgi:hypothetical protein